MRTDPTDAVAQVTMFDFSKLETPADDGEILIEPGAGVWPSLVERNRRLLDHTEIQLAGQPLRDERERFRRALRPGGEARAVLAGGHQPEFVHPGVWAKHVVLRHVADQMEGVALDLVVDHHAPRSGDLVVPVVNGDGWVETRRVKFSEAAAGASYEGRAILDASGVQEAREAIQALAGTWAEDSCIETYLKGLTGSGAPRDFVDQHLAGREAIDRGFEVNIDELRVSDIYGERFVADLLLNAESFAASYNRALAVYRREHQVGGANRPLPDLGREGDRIEAAFWVYKPGARRRRLWLERRGDRMTLYGDGEALGEVDGRLLAREPSAALASLSSWRLRPRALTLTLWARLVACDLFVHGIGGAKYDRITDRILADYYGIEPPAYACVSATLRLPLPVHQGSVEEVRAARRALRDLHFNPQRYATSAPHEHLARRRELIAESDRLRAERGPSVRRREVFRAIREVDERLVASEAGLEDRMSERLEVLERGRVSNRLASSREYFYALQSRGKLEGLVGMLREGSVV